jgi:hypothetical protein
MSSIRTTEAGMPHERMYELDSSLKAIHLR